MAQHDYDIANQAGAAFRSDLNSVLDAIVSNNSGAVEPGTTFAFQWWADTAAGQLKIRNSANDDWITLRELDGTLLIEDGAVATPGLAFADDPNTGVYSSAADTINLSAGGVERAEFGTGAIVFNEDGASMDFRVEGDTNANLLFVDGSADAIGIGTNSPGTLVEIDGSAPYITIKNNTEEDTDGGRESKLIFEGEQSGGEISVLGEIQFSHDGTADDEKGDFIVKVNDGDDGSSPTERLRISSTGEIATTNYSLPSHGTLANRNVVINGAMQVGQRDNASSQTTSKYGKVDRFKSIISGTDYTYSLSQVADSRAQFGFDFGLQHTNVNAIASPDANALNVITTHIEGQDLQRFKKGTAGAEKFTIQFWARASVAGDYIFELNDNNNSRQISHLYTLAANTWKHITHTFPADTTGEFTNDNNISLYVNWWLSAGTNFTSGTLNSSAWAATTTANRAAGLSTTYGSTAGSTFNLTGVQLEVGEVATEFEHRRYADELAACQRYYQRGQAQSYIYYASSATLYGTAPFFAEMRDAPSSVSVLNAGHYGNGFSTSITAVNKYGARINYPASQAGYAGASVVFDANADF